MAHFLNPTLSRESLRNILGHFEAIPEEYRLRLWMEVILQLPNNKTQYLSLREKRKKLPTCDITINLKDEKSNRVCNRVVQSLLAHCPSLMQFTHFNLADFVEPFSDLLSSHEFVYFEVILCILINWCQHWFDHIPLPPYTLLSMMDIIFLKNHPDLYKYLASKSIRAVDYAWRWMRTSFKTVVDSKEWLILWDHILINEPSFMYYIPLAACKLQSRYLLELKSHGDIMEILHSTIPLDAQSLLKETYKMREETPMELSLDQMMHPFHPLILGFYPTLNPTDLITFHSENGALNNLSSLLGKVKETGDETEKVIKDGLALRRWMIGM